METTASSTTQTDSDGAGGVMYTLDNTVISFNGTNSFINNSAAGDGGVIYTSVFDTLYASCLLSFNGTNIFTNNSADSAGGAIYTSDNAILRFNGTSNFTNNLAIYGGTIYSFNRILLSFNGTINFISNSAKIDGGSLYLINSNLSVCPNTTMFWDKNHARYGGAIYVDDQSEPIIYCSQAETSPKECFFFNSLARICPMVLTYDLFSRTILLMLQEVCYMVGQ